MHVARRCRIVFAAALALMALALVATPAGASGGGEPPSPGDPGLGDRLFPNLGNGGYDALHYNLDLRYGSAPEDPMQGTVTIVARATQSLSSFDLDFAGQSVGSVSVNGRRAEWAQEDEELVITPKRPLRKHRKFVVQVSDFVAVPTVPDSEVPASEAFFYTPDGTATAGQPDLAHRFLPSNDHPSDKASFSFRLDVPTGLLAVANGVPAGRRERGDRTIWYYRQREPMATELIQLAVGDYDFISRGRHYGVDVRDVIAPSLNPTIGPLLDVEIGHIDWMQDRVGRYPFDLYGSLVVDAELGFALETQTLSLFDKYWFQEYGQGVWDPTMLHELSHEWFGDSVSPNEWSDLWVNEGHASWYEFVWAEENGWLEEDTEDYPNPTGYADFDDLMEAVYALGDQWRSDYGPVALPASADTLFSLNAYHGGALVLYALREKIGRAAFERVERAWVTRYRNESVGTADFIALASRVAGRDLRGFLGNWLYGTTTPPMPNHPDWTVLPVEEPAPAALAASAGGSARRSLVK
jgi:aminopeptidase N